MGFFSKKEEVPEIPPASALPELPESEIQMERRGLPELPSFPSTPQNENINREMVKSAVADIPSNDEEISVEIPTGLQMTEESPSFATIPPKPIQRPMIPSIPSIAAMPRRPIELNASVPNKPVSKNTEPIFVRIDKFQSAQKNIESVKEKVKEIESILGKIKDVKSKEEIELKGWTEDVEKIKVRLAEIDSDIFNQI